MKLLAFLIVIGYGVYFIVDHLLVQTTMIGTIQWAVILLALSISNIPSRREP